jgi:hypothetical protein
MTVTLDDVQALADQLTMIDKARLAARLNAQLAQDLEVEVVLPTDPGTSSSLSAMILKLWGKTSPIWGHNLTRIIGHELRRLKV